MRDIKVRGWNKRDKSMYNVVKIDFTLLLIHGIKKGGIKGGWFGDWILLQYTGLKDKKGKEIYEGDIVKCGDNQGVVEWDGITLKPFDYISGLEYCHGVTPNYTQEGTEIIGNIYENPEMLDG